MTDLVHRWDVVEGGRLGAIIECPRCHGRGRVFAPGPGAIDRTSCDSCSGSGDLFRGYVGPVLPETVEAFSVAVKGGDGSVSVEVPTWVDGTTRRRFVKVPGWVADMLRWGAVAVPR